MNFFSSLRGTNCKLCVLIRQNQKLVNCQMSPVIIFRLITLKGTAKAPAVELLRLNTLGGTKTAFVTPKRYDEHPVVFFMGVPRPSHGLISRNTQQYHVKIFSAYSVSLLTFSFRIRVSILLLYLTTVDKVI